MTDINRLTQAEEFTDEMQVPVYDPANRQPRKISGAQWRAVMEANLLETTEQGIADVQAAAEAAAADALVPFTAQIAIATAKAAEATTSATNAEASRDALDNRLYPGVFAVAPTLRPDGSSIQSGDEYFDSVANKRFTWNGATWVASDINTANLAASSGSALVGFIQAGAGAVARTAQDKKRDIIDLRDFLTGAEQADLKNSTPSFDLTTKLAAAQTQAETFGTVNGRYPAIQLPAGTIGVAGFSWSKVASLVGQEVGNTRLLYVGAGGAGTYLIGIAAGAGSVPYAGFYNMTLDGYDATSSAGNVAENCILNLGASLDWGFKLNNIQARMCFGDALQLRGTSSVFVHLFMNRLRFDGVGGHAIFCGHGVTGNGSPFVLDQFTLDNNLSGNFATRMAALGHYDGSRWGKGLLRIDDGQGVSALISNARIELNKKLVAHGGAFSLIYSNNTIGGSKTFIKATAIAGQGNAGQSIVFCKDVTNRTDFVHEGIQMSNLGKVFESSTGERDIPRNLNGSGFSGSNVAQQVGIGIYGHQIEYRTSNSPEQVAGVSNYYKFGDLTINATIGAGKPAIWQCKYPTAGFARPNTNSITTTAVVTSGSAVVSVSSASLTNFPAGLRVTINGAGPASANLDTFVVSVDESANTVTFNDAASTSVNPATITFDSAEFAPLVYQQGIGTNIGNASTTATLGTTAPVVLYDSAITADRTVTLATSTAQLGTVAQAWGRFRVVRTAASTGAFNVNIAHNGGTKALTAGQWAEFDFNGSVWILTGAGPL